MNFDEIEFEKNRTLESVLEDLKRGIISWHDRYSGFIPSNPTSDIFYTGVNRFLLYGISKDKGYDVPYFCTKKQAEDKGWSLKDGQEPETLVMIKEYENKKVIKNVNGVDITVLEKVKLPERVIKEFQVYNVSQFSNADITENKFSDELLDKMGELLEIDNISLDDFNDKKEYAYACIHAAVSNIYKDDSDSLKMDLTESFICNSLGLDIDEERKCPVNEWIEKIENNRSDFLKTLSIAENTSKKIIDVYKNNIERVQKEKSLEGVNIFELYEDVARNLQKIYVFNNKYFAFEDILDTLKNENNRKQLMVSLLKKYSKNKNRTHVRDLILIGKVVSSLSLTENIDNQQYVNEIEKEINIIEKSVSIDFGKNFEKHPYNLAVSISKAAEDILSLSKEEIFDRLKDKNGRTEIMDSLGKAYMDKLQISSKISGNIKEINLIKGVINEIAALDNPDLIKNNNKKEPGVKEPSSNVTDKKPTNYKDFASELKNDDSKKQIPFTRYKRGRKK